jgi:GT2 family glycosyltransferase
MYEFAVIIPHYNDVVRLERCLEALMPQASDDIEVVVADNASSVSIDGVVQRWPTVRIVTQTERGAGPARNAGVAATTAPWLLFIDADCVPAPDWVNRGREIARDDVVIGGRVDVFHETPPPQSGAEAFETVFAFRMESYLTKGAFLGSGNLVTSRKVFESVGGFRQAVSEDKDWSQRAARAGFRLEYDKDFAVSHPSRQDWSALRNKWRRLTSESYLLEDSGTRSRIRWVFKALLMPASVFAHLPAVLRRRDLTWLEKCRAAFTLGRLRLTRMIWMIGQAFRNKA